MSLAGAAGPAGAAATKVTVLGPSGSDAFGYITVLDNGNVVVVDPLYDAPGVTNAGAVHLYDGATHTVISTLTGSTAQDQVGSDGIRELDNGHFVVVSPQWDGVAVDTGAVTWVNSTTGLNGVVSATNSLVGSSTQDYVGGEGVTALTNGNYVVRSPFWDDPNTLVEDVGAATWGNGATGSVGAIGSANSIIGSSTNDEVGDRVRALDNGNYVVMSPNWNGQRGAATWGNGATGTAVTVSGANSIVGGGPGNRVGEQIEDLTNGHYVVVSVSLDSGIATDIGAVTWANGTAATSLVVSAANSLVGSTNFDLVGIDGVEALPNGHYVVRSPEWDNFSTASTDAGAVTWGNGNNGSTTGIVDFTNSLVGSTTGDGVGGDAFAVLTNGNYVVATERWDAPGVVNAGAVTLLSGTTGAPISGSIGAITSTNSLIGATANDRLGSGDVTPLTNGNYVIASPEWDNPVGSVFNAGAVTWATGTAGVTGASVSGSNSLIGTAIGDSVGSGGATALTNGHYVVSSPAWNDPTGPIHDVGAVTWANGTTGKAGPVTAADSLIGSTTSDSVSGFGGEVQAMTDGNYVVTSPFWDHSGAGLVDAGAVTWRNGGGPDPGVVGPSNSQVGSTAGDHLGSGGAVDLPGGHYLYNSGDWDDPALPVANAGAVTWAPVGGATGAVTAASSVFGLSVGAGSSLTFDHDPVNNQVVVGSPEDDRLTWMILVPQAPTGVSATPGDSSATVSWNVLAFSSGAAPVQSYTATASPGGASCTTAGNSCVIGGLTNGLTYSFTVRATNAAGTGPSSTASNAVVPHVPLPFTFHGSETLRSGRAMATNRYLLSKDARTLFGLRADGNLILVVNDRLVFQSNTAGQGVTQMLMNRNGALQLLNGSGGVVWSSNTVKRGSVVEVRDGRVVIKSGSKIQWSQGTGIAALKAKNSNRLSSGGTLKSGSYLRSTNKQCALAVLNGEIVTWGPAGVVNYRSNTAGSGATQLKLQSSGNLQLLRANKSVAWQTGTAGRSPRLTITDTCRSVLTSRGAVLWQVP